MCVRVCVKGGGGSAVRKGTPNKTSGFAKIQCLGLPRGTPTSRTHTRFSPPGKGALLELAAPTPGSCGLKVEARFVRLRGPEPLLRRRLPPPRPALVEVVVSLPFFSSALSPHVFPPQQECSRYSWGCG